MGCPYRRSLFSNVFYVSKSSGINTWRDQLKPTQLLQNVARVKGYRPPVLSGNGQRITHGGKDYTLEEFGEFFPGQ